MTFLIDECLHTSLVTTANQAGFIAHHVEYLNLKSAKDWDLLKRALRDESIFVTNNASDFRKLYGDTDLHPGLIIIIPSAAPSLQRELFKAVLRYLESRQEGEIFNRVIEVDWKGNTVTIREYDLPAST